MKHFQFLRPLTTAFLFALLGLNGCNFGTAPGGTEGEGLTGILVDSHSKVAANIRVRVYPDNPAALHKGAAVLPHTDSAVTNSLGRFEFKNLTPGTRYNLAASLSRGDTIFSLFIQNILYPGGRQDLGTKALAISGGITLRVQVNGSDATDSIVCSIAMSPFQALVSDSGICVLNGLPPGVFQITVTSPDFHVALSDAVTVVQGVLSNGGSLQITPIDEPITPATQYFGLRSSTAALWTFNAYGANSPPYSFTDIGPRGAALQSSVRMPLAVSPHGFAVEFENTTPPRRDYFLAPSDTAYDPNRTKWLTVEARVYLTTYPSTANAGSVGQVAGIIAGPKLLIGADGSLQASGLNKSVGESATMRYPRSAAGTVPLGKWVNLAMTVDVASSQLYAYVDGKPVQLTWPSTYSRGVGAPVPINNFTVGGSVFDQPFNGMLDEVRVSNAAVLGVGLPLIIPPLDSATILPNDSTSDPDDALKAWWDFEEGSGTQILDKSGNGHHGTLTGAATWATDGIYGKSLHLSGAGGVEIPASAAFEGLTDFTISTWVWQDIQTLDEPVFEFAQADSFPGTSLWVNTAGYQTVTPGSIYGNLNSTTWQATEILVPAGANSVAPLSQWNHIVMTYKSSTHVGRVYVNGTQRASATVPSNLVPSTFGKFYLGYRIPTSRADRKGATLRGRLDEIKIYGATLTSAQVEDLYAATPTLPRIAVVANADVTISSSVPGFSDVNGYSNKNRGKEGGMGPGSYDVNSTSRSLVHFKIPESYTDAKISKAVIRLTNQGWTKKNVTAPYRVDLHRMLKSWKEGTGSDVVANSATVDGATGLERFWGNQDGSEDWSQVLVGLNDIDAASLKASSLTKSPGDMAFWDFDVTELAKSWASDSTQNFGVIMVTDFPASNALVADYPVFNTRDVAVADSLKPLLILNGD
jgi:hypothetical protein